VIRSGDIHLADLNDEVRRRVLIVSNDRFHAASGRALVAPEVPVEIDEVLFPWRVRIDDAVYAVDLLRSLPMERLLERSDRASVTAMASVRRALLHIT
jgi:mRNA-degrading endonuclease toxin of MazEF toxin-antitoxin module